MSIQLAQYLAARSDGAPVEIAADMVGFSLTEARLTETAVAKGELQLPGARARAREDQLTKEGNVARDNEETELKNAIHGRLQEAGFTRKPGTNEFTAPAGFAETSAAPEKTKVQSVAADQLRLFIERIERLAEERKGIADDIAEVYGEAKAMGYDKPTMRRIVRLRAMEPHHRQEAAALLETYANAVGLQDVLPL